MNVNALVRWLSDGRRSDEIEARRVLATLLRGSQPLDVGLRFVLAALFDPDARVLGRYLAFKRVRGNRKKQLDHRRIAAHVWRATRDGGILKAVVSDAAKKFRCHQSTVFAAWAVWRPIFEKYSGQQKALTRD